MADPIRIALFAASPVYYQAPLYRRLASDPRLDFTAIFASTAGVRPADLGYAKPVAWDADALGGYRSIFLRRADRAEINRGALLRHRDPEIVLELLRGDYEVLWTHGYNSLTHLLAIATQLAQRRPLLVREEQTLLHPRTRLKRTLKAFVLGAIMGRAHALYIGTENRCWFNSFGVPASRQFSVPYCVETDRLERESERLKPMARELRRDLGLRDVSSPVILSVARLIPKKQPQFLLEAFRRVRAQRRCSLLLVGSGELEAEIARLVALNGIPDVVLVGFLNQSEVGRAYVAADVFALPSKFDETWGIAVNEAMSFGLPVVVSDKVGCAADLVHDGINGFVVSSEEPSELAERFETLVESPQLRARFGVASRQLVSRVTYQTAADGVLRAVAAAVGPERWEAAVRVDETVPRTVFNPVGPRANVQTARTGSPSA